MGFTGWGNPENPQIRLILIQTIPLKARFFV